MGVSHQQSHPTTTGPAGDLKRPRIACGRPTARFRRGPVLAAIAAVLALSGAVAPAIAADEGSLTSDPAAATVPMSFDVQGAAEVRTGIRGRVTIAGTFAGAYDPATGTFEGGFRLTPTRAHVTVLGLLPVVAETDWTFTESVTGQWRDGVLHLRIAARIRHPRLLAYGVVIAGGANCATRRASVIELRSPAGVSIADPLAGATLTTSGQGFTISALSGCGVLDGLLSAVAAGGGNQATLRLTPRAAS